MRDIYMRTETDLLIHLFFSCNEPCDPKTATAVISVNIFTGRGQLSDGGEFDIQSEDMDLKNYVGEALEFMGIGQMKYEYISEAEFDKIVEY